MRKLVCWLRSIFCKHEWRERGTTRIWWMDEEGRQWGQHPRYTMLSKECTRCGWVWRQKL